MRLRNAAREAGVNQIVVERDYARTRVLLGLAGRPELRDSLVFKGGTALRKVRPPPRFSATVGYGGSLGPRGAVQAGGGR